MEPSTILEWALYVGFAILIFNSITGFDEVISKIVSKSPTKKDLALKVEQLEARVKKLESGKV
ncbi:hypothetical protein [Thalassotalea ganghwensis]